MPSKKQKKRQSHSSRAAPAAGRCRAITRNNEQCTSTAASPTGKQSFCEQHGEEYKVFYLRYKELQMQLEDLKPPEAYSVGGTGRAKPIPISKAEIQACRHKTMLQSLSQYYRARLTLIKRNIQARKWFMEHFHTRDQDLGHTKAVRRLQVESAHIKEVLFTVEQQYNNLSLPHKTGERLGKWQDAVKDHFAHREMPVAENTSSVSLRDYQHAPTASSKLNNVSSAAAQAQRSGIVKPMECLTVRMVPPEEEPDPLAAALAARRQELLGDFWYFLRYRFPLELEPWCDFIRITECIFRRIVLATPSALERSRSYATIRTFLEDESIRVDILEELWDLMQECPPSLVWDAISDYRTFVNTQFEKHRDVPDDEKIYLLGGYIHLAESLCAPSSSPEISWFYLSQLSYSCCLAKIYALARSFREAVVLDQLLHTVDFYEWGHYLKVVESTDSLPRRHLRAACALCDILIKLDHGPPFSDIQLADRPPIQGPMPPWISYFPSWVEYQTRPLVFFQLGIDDPFSLPLIEEFKKSPHMHRIWAKNTRTNEIVCAPESPQDWTNRVRWALRKANLPAAEFTVLATLADSLSWAQERAMAVIGGRMHPALMSRTYSDYYDVLVVSILEGHNIEWLLQDILNKAVLVRGYKAGILDWDGGRQKQQELLESHPFISLCPLNDEEDKHNAFDEARKNHITPSLRRCTRWPQEADEWLTLMDNIAYGPPESKKSGRDIDWKRHLTDCHTLARMLEDQGIIEIDTSYAMDMDKPIGAAFTLFKHSGFYIDVKGRMIFDLDSAFIRPWKSDLPPDDMLVCRASSYHGDHPKASFTLFILCSGAVHWPFKFHCRLPYWFTVGADTNVHTSRYILKDPPGSEEAVHGYMNYTFTNLKDCVIWRDLILCMKPSSEEMVILSEGLQARKQGSSELAEDLQSLAAVFDKDWNEHLCFEPKARALGYDRRKFESLPLKFEVHGPMDLKNLQQAMDKFWIREWE